LWSNIDTRQSGEFNFQLNSSNNRFDGFYTINGIKRNWNGKKFLTSEFTHLLSTNTLALRNKALTGIDFNKMKLPNLLLIIRKPLMKVIR